MSSEVAIDDPLVRNPSRPLRDPHPSWRRRDGGGVPSLHLLGNLAMPPACSVTSRNLVAPRTVMTLQTGSRLGPYEILSPLGAGGMGEVYRARDTRLGREVAIKVLPDSVSADAERLRRFE